eukprot:7824409-Karenia_brevis.AAC.1
MVDSAKRPSICKATQKVGHAGDSHIEADRKVSLQILGEPGVELEPNYCPAYVELVGTSLDMQLSRVD